MAAKKKGMVQSAVAPVDGDLPLPAPDVRRTPQGGLTPMGGEVAPIYGGRDILRGLINWTLPLMPLDPILLTRGGGDLLIYEELLRDDAVYYVFQQRRGAVTGRELLIEPGAKDAQSVAFSDFITEVHNDILNFDDHTDKMLYGNAYGFGVGEAMWATDGRFIVPQTIKVRRQRRFRFYPDGGLALKTVDNLLGERVPDKKFWTFNTGLHDDDPYGLGLCHWWYWPVYFKRGSMEFWLAFLERFGQPTVTIKHPQGLSDAAKNELLARVKGAVQKDGVMLIPDNMLAELLEGSKTTGDYADMVQRMDDAITKVGLSQSMTTADGSSRSQAEVHMEVRQEIVRSDSKIIHDSYRSTVLTWLRDWNFPGARLPKITRDLTTKPDLVSQSQRDKNIWAMGFKPTLDYIRETYGEGWDMDDTPRGPQPGDPLASFAEDDQARLRAAIESGDLESAVTPATRPWEQRIQNRVDTLMARLRETGDLRSFREDLTAALHEDPHPATVQDLERGGLWARLKGILSAQRNTDHGTARSA